MSWINLLPLMLIEDIKRLKTGPRDLRKFGLSVGGVLLLLACWFFYRQKAHYPYFVYPGVALVALGFAFPKSLKWIYIGWMTLGLALGLIVSTVLLTLFFYLVVSPMGVVARLCGKDFLERKWNPSAPTYWRSRDRSKSRSAADYERQF